MAKPVVAVDVRALVGPISGIGFYTQALLERLPRSGWADYLAVAHTPTRIGTALEDAGVAFEYQSAPLGVLWQQLVLPRRLARGDIDLLWSPLLTLPMTGDLPAVVTIHDLTPLVHPETHTLKVKLSTLPFLRRTVSRARRIVVDSKATAADIERYYPRGTEKTRVVYPGVDPAFRPASEERIARTRLDLGCENGFILFAGTLEPRKNLAFLLDAWEALQDASDRAPALVIAGGYGWRSRGLERRINRLSKEKDLFYLGRISREKLVETFQAASLFVLPSLYEGFGLPAAEAMACGIPTIATRTSSLPEVVGDAGLLVESNDVQGLTRTMLDLCRDPARAADIGQRCRERSSRFDWDRAAAEMEEVFREALR